MNTPKLADRRHNNEELAALYAQKVKPTKAQRKLARRVDDYEQNIAKFDGHDGKHFIKPGSNH